jgi:hypothetical protein
MATTIRGSDNWDSALAKSVAIIADVKGYNTDAGTFTQDAWRDRSLNTELDDPSNIVTIASNEFTLQAGTYLIEWSAPAYDVGRHTTRLYNVTDSTVEAVGAAMVAASANNVMNSSTGASIVTITGAKAFKIQHQCQTTKSTTGLGVDTGMSGINSVYTVVKIHLIGA